MRVLFICNQNKHRSKTAEVVFRTRFETRSAGLYNDTPVTKVQLAWADIIVVMEEEQRIELVKRFPSECSQKRLVCLDISDAFSYGQPALLEQLERKMSSLEPALELFSG